MSLGEPTHSYAVKKYIHELDTHSVLVPVSFDLFLSQSSGIFVLYKFKPVFQKKSLNSSLKRT